MALAPLGFTVDTGPVAKAVADLDRLTGATVKAEAATKTVAAGTNAAAASTRQLGAATAAAATQMTIATNAVMANNAAIAITNQSAAAAQQQMRNLSFQFQDIGTMLMAGQSPFALLAQQLPQVTMYGGRLNGVMGALKSTVAGLFSPLGLVTTGFVLAASAAISYFSDASDEADKAADALEKQRDLIRGVADEWGGALPAIKAYADEQDRIAGQKKVEDATAMAVQEAWSKVKPAVDEAEISIANVIALLAMVPEHQEAVDDAARAFFNLDEQVDSGKATLEDLDRVSRALTTLFNQSQNPAVRDLATAFSELSGEIATASEKTAQFLAEQNLLALQQGKGLSPLGTIPPVYSGGGKFQDANDVQTDRANAAKSQFQIEQERLARRGRRGQTEAERAAERYADLIRGSQQFIEAQELERQALGMTEEAAQALRYEQELLNQAANDNIDLTPRMAAELSAYAAAMAAAEAETQRLQEAMDFANDLAKGFMSDLLGGLRDGQSLFESFADAAENALQRIADKLLDMAMDQMIQSLFSNLMGAFGGGMGGGGIGWGDDTFRYAKGGVFDGSNVVPFAKGGVVNHPTVFPFANGIGLMGEAGPEGILPLRRNSSGQLGVIAANQNGGVPVVNVTIHNNGNDQVSQETTQRSDGTIDIKVMIDKEVSRVLSTPGTKSNRALKAFGGRPPLKNVGG